MVLAKSQPPRKKKAPSESGHFYYGDGSPCFVVPNLSQPGKDRNTTVADARKLGLYPSVTTIIGCLKSLDLNYWSEGVVIDTCYDNPMSITQDKNEYEDMIRAIVTEFKAKAPDEGTKVHKSLETNLFKEHIPEDHPHFKQIISVNAWLFENGIEDGESEVELVPDDCGFGGCVDFRGFYKDSKRKCVIDFKTVNTVDKKIIQRDSHKLQLAAYKLGLGKDYIDADLINLYVSRDNPGFVEAIRVPEEQHMKLTERFVLLKSYYEITNKLTKGDRKNGNGKS